MSKIHGHVPERQHRDCTTQHLLVLVLFVILVVLLVVFVLYGPFVKESSLSCISHFSNDLVIIIIIIKHGRISQRQFAPSLRLREQRRQSIQPLCRGCCQRLVVGTRARCVRTRTRARTRCVRTRARARTRCVRTRARARISKQWGSGCTVCSTLSSTTAASLSTGILPTQSAIPSYGSSNQPTFTRATATSSTTTATTIILQP